MSEEVTGKDIRLQFDGARCIHARNCVLTLPQVFKANVEGPWIDPDAASADEIATLARRCPSGAITYTRLDGQPDEATPVRNVLAVSENGPYVVRADLKVRGEAVAPRAVLCRCGASKNKPYCDHSHVDAGFAASGEIPSAPQIPGWGEAGPLEVSPLPNGPLKVVGALEITCGSGRTINRTTQAFLCRCGQSANKPYCDGSHRAAGFQAE